MLYWYSTPDDAGWGAWSDRIKWCEENCKGMWKYKLQGKFHFNNKDDYLMFLLRWS